MVSGSILGMEDVDQDGLSSVTSHERLKANSCSTIRLEPLQKDAAGCSPAGSHLNDHILEESFKDVTGLVIGNLVSCHSWNQWSNLLRHHSVCSDRHKELKSTVSASVEDIQADLSDHITGS